jgi:Ca-activated chloride channel homolog
VRTPLRILLACSVMLFELLWAATAAHAQTAVPGGNAQIHITQVDNSKFPQVTVYLSVTDASGQPIGVDPSTIQLSENGQAMQPTSVVGGGKGAGIGPLTTMLLIDVSGSMGKNGKLAGAQAAAKAYVNQMRPGDQAGLMTYNTQANYVAKLTTDHNALDSAIDSIKAGGNTAMYDALVTAEAALKDVSGRKAVIVLTDGLDNSSSHKEGDVISGLGPSGLSISTIGLGDPSTKSQTGLDQAGLQSLAQQAGGQYSFAGDAQTLSALFQQYGRSLQNEYAFTYISPSKLRDGVNRNLTVSLTGAAAATVSGQYNPGGVVPEVPTQSWPLFIIILVVLLLLVAVPIVLRALPSFSFPGGGGGSKKGRIKLAGSSGGSSAPAPAANPNRSHVRIK